mgnify:CR=1 FL=1
MFDHITKDVQLAMFASMVRGIVLYHAQHLRLLVTYGAIADAVKTLPRGGQLAQALALITEDDHKAKRPLSTAAVVNAEFGIPGLGFFEQCRSLGFHIGRTPDAEYTFWKNQLDRMHVAPFTLEGVVQARPSDETRNLAEIVDILQGDSEQGIALHRRFVTRADGGGRTQLETTRPVDVRISADETARLIRENAKNFGAPRRRIVESPMGNPAPEPTSPSVKEPASGLPG